MTDSVDLDLNLEAEDLEREKREREMADAGREQLLVERTEWMKESDFYRCAQHCWQDWGSELLDERGLQLQCGSCGDADTRKILGNIVCERDPFHGFEDPEFHKMLAGEKL